MPGRARSLLAATAAAVAAIAAVAILRTPPAQQQQQPPLAASTPPPVAAQRPPAGPPSVAAASPAVPTPEGDAAPFDPRTWDAVDLNAVRHALPGNLYWESGFPTEDLRVQREREEQAAFWNVQYGKVLSGTGTDEEIRAYFAHRQRLSSDYAELATYVLDHHEKSLPERDIALLELARRLHLARLEEIPRRLEEGYARKRAQDEARAAWLADEAAFGEE
jgi:hypothetical protein